MNLWGLVKGLLVHDETDKTKEIALEIDPAASTGTRTTVKSAQTLDRTLNLPDASDTLVGKQTSDVLENKTIDFTAATGNNSLSADAVDVVYDNSSSGLLAVDVQAAVDEVEARVDVVEADLAAHLVDAVDAHDASAISNVPAGTIASTDVQSAINELDSDSQANAAAIAAHLADAVDAHDASAISNVPSGNLAATDVQGALDELQTDIDSRALQTSLDNHINDAVDAHDASAISNVPLGNLSSTDVQGALNELQSDVDAISGGATASNVGAGSEVFKQQVLTNLEFRTLTQGTGITLTQNADDIEIAATGGSGANTALSNLVSTAVNANIVPATDATVDLGSTSKRFLTIYGATVAGGDISTGNASVIAIQKRLSSVLFPHTVTSLILAGFGTGASAAPLAIVTQNDSTNDANASKEISILSGDKTAGTGNSGAILLQTGTSSGGVRGEVAVDARQFHLSNGTSLVEDVLIYAAYGLTPTDQLLRNGHGVIIIQSSTAITINGIEAGTQGQHLIIYNENNNNMSFANESGSATAADRIVTCTGATVTSTGTSCHKFIYLSNRWVMVANQL